MKSYLKNQAALNTLKIKQEHYYQPNNSKNIYIHIINLKKSNPEHSSD